MAQNQTAQTASPQKTEEQKPAKKPWKTPRVIVSTLRETETGHQQGCDGTTCGPTLS